MVYIHNNVETFKLFQFFNMMNSTEQTDGMKATKQNHAKM